MRVTDAADGPAIAGTTTPGQSIDFGDGALERDLVRRRVEAEGRGGARFPDDDFVAQPLDERACDPRRDR
mgnify:CR=1 FL=1